ncbi:hypothetical protein NLU13_6159 [Sarocladium strictum]|uniref:Uncharacterized protein n=1 Tax=Sarocladium strictum TaxID=5046 RepID=A0AA39GHR9_SARSR|nr:hypothetical protein NLU13_6159 [Sarocladium strictum]
MRMSPIAMLVQPVSSMKRHLAPLPQHLLHDSACHALTIAPLRVLSRSGAFTLETREGVAWFLPAPASQAVLVSHQDQGMLHVPAFYGVRTSTIIIPRLNVVLFHLKKCNIESVVTQGS